MLPENILNTWTAWDFLAKVAGMQLLQAGRPGNQFYASFASGTWEKKHSGKCHPWFFFGRHPSLLLSTAQSTQSPLEKKKSIAYPKKLKKARISKEMAAAAQRHPRGLAITSRGALSLPTHTLPPPRPGAGSNPRSPHSAAGCQAARREAAPRSDPRRGCR